MSRATIWSVLDNLLSDAGSEISETTGEIVDNTDATIQRATDGDDRI